MLEGILNSRTQVLLKKSLDVASLRNDVIANNIANIDTPNYKRREVIFEEKVQKVLENATNYVKLNTTDARHMNILEKSGDDLLKVTPEVRIMNNLSYRNDENNVDIDTETAAMTKNSLYYDSLSQSISHEIRLLRLAITGRR
ncbi:MAG: flagellar basal body rod protein FlgB [Syntrophomonadaceae bacterium]